METITFAVIAAFIIGFGAISGRIQRTIITAPMLFVLFGLLISEWALGMIGMDIETEFINIIAELTLVLVLFTDASRIDLMSLRKEHNLPTRMLVIGLPLTIVGGALLAAVMFDALTVWEAVVLAIILAPTDAALAQAVLENPRVPPRIRQTLNVESGLNDGIALPILLFFASVAAEVEGEISPAFWLEFAALQLILGPLIGILVGYVGGRTVQWGTRTGWMTDAFQRLAAIGLALLAFAAAESVGGNGFIAAFAAGLTIGNTSRAICHCLYEFAEAEGQLLMLVTFMLFGAVMVVPAVEQIDATIVLYAILALTVIRMLPVALSLIGVGLQGETVLFLGWFGPRGIASILYGLLILEEGLQGGGLIFTVMVVTVLISVFAHGFSALIGVKMYANRLKVMQEEHPDMEMPEEEIVSELPTRYMPMSEH